MREALRNSKGGLPHPTDWDSFLQEFLDDVEAKSWSLFAKSAVRCSIELEGDQLGFLPFKNLGPREHYNFVPIVDRKMTVSANASDEELGLFLNAAFDACE